jgi:CubicO group peptidase (beta-lactamase class C family)
MTAQKLSAAHREQIRELVASMAANVLHTRIAPGFGIIVQAGNERFSAYAGKADLEANIPFSGETGLEMSCLMKICIVVITLDLVRRGILNMKRSVGEYLPDLTQAAPAKAASITIEHILSHTAGDKYMDVDQAAYRWGASWPRLIQFIAESPQIFPPGAIFSYGHSWHVVLGEILRRATGKSPRELVESEILCPLGVTLGTVKDDRLNPARALCGYIATAQGPAKKNVPPPGSFWEASLPQSTLRLDEILDIGQAILNAGHAPSGVFQAELHSFLEQPFASSRSLYYHSYSERHPYVFSRGCGHYRYGLIGCNGSAQGRTTALRINLKKNYVIAVAMNTWNPTIRDHAIEEVARLLSEGDLENEAEAGLLVARDVLGGYPPAGLCGAYKGNNAPDLEVRAESGALHLYRADKSLLFIRGITGAEDDAPLNISPPLPLSFFRHKGIKEPLLAIGGHVYCKAGTAI